MRAKLERIAAGKIEFDRPVVTLSDSVVTLSCRPGEKAEGSFTLTADRPVKGMAYASTSRMTLEHPSFHSRTARIFCSYDARGLWGGEEIEGEFWLVTEAGEFHIPYTVRVEAHQEPEKENYAYFISADPIEPLPEEQEEALVIGSGATHGQIANSPLVRRFAPPLAQACAQVGAQQLRNRATLGGNIANASPAGDTLAPLAALDAFVELDRLGRHRRLPLTELILAPGRTALEEREFIRTLWVPKLPEGARSGFLKIGHRQALAISRLTLAAVLILGAEGTIRELRLSVGAVFPRPLRFAELEKGARGLSAEDDCLEEIARALSEKIPEAAGRRASTAYKQPVCRLACLGLLKELRDGHDYSL